MKPAAIVNSFLITFFSFSIALAKAESVKLDPNEVMVQVNGVVCSFCAQGIRKKLSNLNFINKTKYKDGVKMDIKNQRLFIALDPKQKVNMKAVYTAISTGGYEPIKTYLSDLKGKMTEYHNENEEK